MQKCLTKLSARTTELTECVVSDLVTKPPVCKKQS